MKINIRVAYIDDVEGIVQVHCSGIDRWVRHTNAGAVEVNYDDLSVAERFRHSDPWMSVETCTIHLNNLLTNGQYPLIAELNGRIVGEVEIYVCSEED